LNIGSADSQYYGRFSTGDVESAGASIEAGYFDLSDIGVPEGEAITSIRVALPSNADFWGIASIYAPLGIDLSVANLENELEETSGMVVPLNSNRDENNFNASGNPVPDYEPDASAGHRALGEDDRQLLPATLSVGGNFFDFTGLYTLTALSEKTLETDIH